MKAIRFLLLIPLVLALISCEPIRITTKVEPFKIEPPKEAPVVKKSFPMRQLSWLMILKSQVQPIMIIMQE